jgi:hypothetical protein
VTTSYIKKNKIAYNAKIKKHIISLLENQSISRQALVRGVLTRLGLDNSEINDNCVDGACVLLRSYIGAVINEGIDNGEIIEENKLLTLKLNTIYLSNAQVKEHIKGILKENVALTKHEIFEKCISHFGADKTFSDSDDNIIRAFAGEFLARCERTGVISTQNGKYTLTVENETKLDTYESFLNAINENGGEYFEHYGAMLIRKFYEKSGFTVTECAVTGGSDDGGVDIVVRTEDKLGFKDFIAVQAKARKNAHVTIKEVREFIGAMHTTGANRGIYLTTSYFHEEAEKLISEIPNVTKIDGKRLFELAKECNFFKI